MKVLKENIVIAAGLHFGKAEFFPFAPQSANVNQFRIVLTVPGRQNIRQCVCGIQRRQARNAQLHTPPVQPDEIPDIFGFCGAGQNDIFNKPLFQHGKHMAVLSEFAYNFHIGSQTCNFPRCTIGCIKPEAHVIQFPRNVHNFRLVAFVHRN